MKQMEEDGCIYVDGNECILVSPQGNAQVDVQILVFASNPYEVIWCPKFSNRKD